MKKFKKENGIVLLSCLVFLLVILAMLRFSLTSARVEEQKVGIDAEILNAKKSAEIALKAAEKFILLEGKAYCLRKRAGDDTFCKNNATKYSSELFGDVDKLKTSTYYNKGIYTAQQVEANVANCTPFWRCVNWSNKSDALTEALNNNLPYRTISCADCPNTGAFTPEFVVEHFFYENVGADNISAKKSKSVILRVTALGYGKDSNNRNNTNSLLQATYVMPNNS